MILFFMHITLQIQCFMCGRSVRRHVTAHFFFTPLSFRATSFPVANNINELKKNWFNLLVEVQNALFHLDYKKDIIIDLIAEVPEVVQVDPQRYTGG